MTDAEREACALSARLDLLAKTASEQGLNMLGTMLTSPGQVNHFNIIKELELLATQTNQLNKPEIEQLIEDYRAYYMPAPTKP